MVGACSWVEGIKNLFWWQGYDEYAIYEISCLKKEIFLVWLYLGERKVDVAAAKHWSENHVLRGSASIWDIPKFTIAQAT